MSKDNLQHELHQALTREVDKHISRYNLDCRSSHKNAKRYTKRTGKSATKVAASSLIPTYWQAHNLFNPFYVRKRIDNIAHGLATKIRASTYKPNPSLVVSIPKPAGGNRDISIFTIPDSAVAYWVNQILIRRNQPYFSSYCFAYRTDRNGHNAISHLMTELRSSQRHYLLEYDFSKYFDTIRHEYLISVLKKHLKVSPREMHLINAFLEREYAISIEDLTNNNTTKASIGVPQGCSISLFLANVAALELDRKIERISTAFARYADDTVILCENYESASRCAKVMLEHGTKAGTEINLLKSAGISVLSSDTEPEMRGKTGFTFLSHYLTQEGVSFGSKAIERMKRRSVRIIYNNLLLYPKKTN